MILTQLFPGKVITTVAYGTSDLGYPIMLVATADGCVTTLEADGYNVYPEFKVRNLQTSLQE